MTPLERTRILLFRAAECDSSMVRSDYLFRARDELVEAGYPRWSDIAAAAATAIGGDGRDIERLLFEIDLECSRREHALPEAAQ